ncbi:MAG: acetylhydrolase [Acidimicrobiales bacterium]|nr:MAG: acetylhydrolase [Acidimicrobiales bacterium]
MKEPDHARVDPQLRPLVEVISRQERRAEEMDPQTLRAELKAITALLGEPEPVAEVHDFTLPGPAAALGARLYRPGHAPNPSPCLVWFHGGGWTIGDLDTHDHLCRELANLSGCAVLSVDYRLAPEHPFPAAVEDCDAALSEAHARAPELGLDPRRMGVGGDSAGGNLAAVCSLLARDRGDPPLRFQLLVYPVTVLGDRFPSRTEYARGCILTREHMRFFEQCYLQGHRPAADWRASPLDAPDLSGLPETHLVLAELDPLRDEGRAYAEALAAAGCEVTVDEVSGVPHLFFQLGPVADVSRRTVERAAARLRETLHP